MSIRLLHSGDEPQVEAFLAGHADTSMLLRSNLGKVGLVDRAEPFHATWAGSFEGDRLCGVAAHTWLQTVILQAPRLDEAAALARTAARACQRPLKALIGPLAQVESARQGLGLAGAETTLDEAEVLFTLPLCDLRVPAALAEGRVRCRQSEPADLPQLVRWRKEFLLETGLEREGPGLEEAARNTVALAQGDGRLYTLVEGSAPVATTAFNAVISGAAGLQMVQIGGVFTPKELRGKGHARAAVAGQLLDAQGRGAARAVLFTGREQRPAQAAYRSLGFVESGDYALVYFREPALL